MLFNNLYWWQYVIVMVALAHLSGILTTVYLHRYLTHRALELSYGTKHVCRFLLWLTLSVVPREWKAVHLKHHSATDTKDDTHSPQIHGLLAILFGGYWYYRKAVSDKELVTKYGGDEPNDWLEKNLYSIWWLGILIFLITNILLFGKMGIVIWIVNLLWAAFASGGIINGIGHYFGYRNYETKDASTNIVPIAIIICGEELHNNHHGHPGLAKLSTKWWEFDMGWFYIYILTLLNLAKNAKYLKNGKIITLFGKEA